jgi:predicted Rossmann fold nucleotide-binding protein DprA/Smf involved in DNA uptake
MAEGRGTHKIIEAGQRWVEHVMQRSEKGPIIVPPLYHTKAGTDVEQRRRVIVALLHQHQHGLTAREIREATGFSKNLTDSALSGLFVRSVVYKRGHSYVLAGWDDAAACS